METDQEKSYDPAYHYGGVGSWMRSAWRLKLLDAVHRSDEYQEYQKQAAQLEADPELKARVMRFRGDNFRLQNHSDKDELFHIAEQLNQESASLRQNLKVNAYLDAELALCRLMQRICRTLVDGIDIQIPDL